jgi:hypothetical protein
MSQVVFATTHFYFITTHFYFITDLFALFVSTFRLTVTSPDSPVISISSPTHYSLFPLSPSASSPFPNYHSSHSSSSDSLFSAFSNQTPPPSVFCLSIINFVSIFNSLTSIFICDLLVLACRHPISSFLSFISCVGGTIFRATLRAHSP